MSILSQRLIDRQRRVTHAGELRIAGEKEPNRPGKPLEHFRLTNKNEEMLKAAAEVYGGEVVHWFSDGKPKGFQLYTKRAQIKAFFSTHEKENGDLESLSISRDIWAGDTHIRDCDGTHCKIWEDTGKKTRGRGGKEQPVFEQKTVECLCAQGIYHGDKQLSCVERARASFLLSEFPSLGLWHLVTGSQTFMEEALGLVDQIQMLGMMGQVIPVTLTIVKQTKRTGPGVDNDFFPMVKIEIDPNPVSLPQVLGAVRDRALALPASSYGDTAALPPSAPALPPATSPNGLSDEQKAEAFEYIKQLGFVTSELEALKTKVKEAGLVFTLLCLEAKRQGMEKLTDFTEYVDDQITTNSAPANDQNEEPQPEFSEAEFFEEEEGA